jgi:hypothetical protein
VSNEIGLALARGEQIKPRGGGLFLVFRWRKCRLEKRNFAEKDTHHGVACRVNEPTPSLAKANTKSAKEDGRRKRPILFVSRVYLTLKPRHRPTHRQREKPSSVRVYSGGVQTTVAT